MMMPPVGVPPPDMNPGNINVIGNANNRRSTDVFAKENTIQVRNYLEEFKLNGQEEKLKNSEQNQISRTLLL